MTVNSPVLLTLKDPVCGMKLTDISPELGLVL